MSLLAHAEKEFEIAGWKKEGTDESQVWVMDNIRALLKEFSSQGHSGSSAPYVINLFKKLASFEIITPLTGEDSEWTEVGGDVFQNKRASAVFKDGKDGKPYYIEAVVWVEENGCAYTGGANNAKGERIGSRQFIKGFPFIPKIFYVDVTSKEIEKDDWEHTIKDEKQLDAVFNYYAPKEPRILSNE